MGLMSIRERAALLGGVATVTSAPGAGSEVRVTGSPDRRGGPGGVGVEV